MKGGKPSRPHPEKALNPARVRTLTEPGRYGDGNGLYLIVEDSGAKRWMLRTVVHGRRRDLGLGSLRFISLAEARELAARYRRMARDGGDPVAERRKARAVIPSFEVAARTVHEEHAPSWRNPKHAAQWINTLAEYAFPVIGGRRIDQIETPDLLKVLSPIWLTKPETARRVRQRMRTVFDWAKASGFRTGDNPVDGVTKGLPKQSDRQRHHAALPYADVPLFIDRLRKSGISEIARLAFELLILTAARTGEVLRARWSEINFDAKAWTVPAERMKAGRAHRVPLSDACLTILRRARELAGGSDFLFPSQSPDKPLSNMVFLMALRRMKLGTTAHGFRASFRNWSAEQTSFPREVCELALAHTVENKTEAAYRRGDLLEKRRDLMDAWARFATSSVAKVIPLRSTGR